MNSFQPGVRRPTFPCCPAPVMSHKENVRINTSRSEAASIMGSATGGSKATAAKKNGAKGGRPEGS